MLKNKVIIITGAAGGIGSALANLVTQKGAILVLTDISKEKIEKIAKNLGKITEKEVMYIEHDVTSLESWDSLIDAVQKKYSQIDILVNNAGVVQPGAAEEILHEKVYQQVSVNLLGTIYGCRAALRVMKKQKFGKIVNVASLGSIIPMSGEAVYSATKFAIRGYSHSLYAELLDSPIDVIVVCPDSVDTPLLDYELLYDESVLSFIGKPMTIQHAAKRILKAIRTKKPEILIPSGTGIVARIGMAYPSLFFLIFPLLKLIGSRNIKKKAEREKD